MSDEPEERLPELIVALVDGPRSLELLEDSWDGSAVILRLDLEARGTLATIERLAPEVLVIAVEQETQAHRRLRDRIVASGHAGSVILLCGRPEPGRTAAALPAPAYGLASKVLFELHPDPMWVAAAYLSPAIVKLPIPDAQHGLSHLTRTIRALRLLGIRVIATQIETSAQLEVARALRVDLAQGYHLARPMAQA